MKQRRTASRNTVGGALRSFILFQKRGEVDDGFGNMVPGGAFVTQFPAYANFRPLMRGSAAGVEDVFADRLQGNQPYIITVRNQEALKEVTTAWRIVDARSSTLPDWVLSTGVWNDNGRWLEDIPFDDTGVSNSFRKIYNIKSPPSDSTNGYMWLEFVATLDEPS